MLRRLRYSLIVLAATLSLAACGAGRLPQPGSAATAPVADIAPAPPPIASLPRPPEPTGGPPSDAQRLIGLKGDTLRLWIGDTVFVRRDGIAEIWRFAAEDCFLDVFLYRENDGLRIAHLDARAKIGQQRVTPQSCYGSILSERKPAPPSG